jgi:biotin carboxyl carrier protein
VDGTVIQAALEPRGAGRARLETPDGPFDLVVLPVDPDRDRVAGSANPSPRVPAVEVLVAGWRFVVHLEPARQARLRELARRGGPGPEATSPAEVRAIIPGRVASVAVQPGDAVQAGQAMLVVEAMKMQNELRAPRAGTVRSVAVVAGQTVDAGALLVVIE